MKRVSVVAIATLSAFLSLPAVLAAPPAPHRATPDCHPADAKCRADLLDFENGAQDVDIIELYKQRDGVVGLRSRLKALEKQYATTAGRLAGLELLLNSMPKDWIGRSDVDAMIQAAARDWAGLIGDLDARLSGRLDVLDGRLKSLETTVADHEARLKKVEKKVDEDTDDHNMFEVGGFGIATKRGFGGGGRIGLLLPLEIPRVHLLLGVGAGPSGGILWAPSVVMDWDLTHGTEKDPGWFFMGPGLVGAIDQSDLSETDWYALGVSPAMTFEAGPLRVRLLPFIGVGAEKPGTPEFDYGAEVDLTLFF